MHISFGNLENSRTQNVKIAANRNSALTMEKNNILKFLSSYFLSISWSIWTSNARHNRRYMRSVDAVVMPKSQVSKTF
jgi:hypothetical protein